tara:strand:+ start:29 stop:313 length:285 start_codon:yes stop_codon:yes gene_type:complete
MVLEIIVLRALESLVPSFALFISIASIQSGLSKIGKQFKIPLIVTFFSIWGLATISGFLFGDTGLKKFTIVATGALLIGILFWLISIIIAGLKK